MKRFGLILPFVLMVGLLSCGHKHIDCPLSAAGIEILFEWDNARNAEVDGMTVFFYPLDGHSRTWRFDISGRDGGPVELPCGTYRMIAYNNDLPGVSVDDTGSAASIRAVAARPLAEGIYAGTGMLYGAVVSEVQVTPCGVRYLTPAGTLKECGRGLIRCSPDSLATQYTVEITNADGTDGLRSAAAALGPLNSAILLENSLPAGDGARLYMPLDIRSGQRRLSGRGCLFGTPRQCTSALNLSLRAVSADGKSIIRTLEIMPESLNIITPHNVIITLDGIDLSSGGDSTSGDLGGIDAAVDGWNVVEIDLESTIHN